MQREVIVDNLLFEMGDDNTNDNPFFELADGTSLDCSIAFGGNNKE